MEHYCDSIDSLRDGAMEIDEVENSIIQSGRPRSCVYSPDHFRFQVRFLFVLLVSLSLFMLFYFLSLLAAGWRASGFLTSLNFVYSTSFFFSSC